VLAKSPWRQLTAVTGLVAVSLVLSWLTPAPTKPAKVVAAPAVTTSTDHPAETVPATYHSTAVGTEPAYLSLPTIKAAGYIQKVGIDQNHQVAVPTNIHLAGWFVDTVKPGDPGLSIIDGHLDGRTQPGIFIDLAELKIGDIFDVRLATGDVRHFRVKSVQSLPVAQAASLLFSQDPTITRQLNLITCGGSYNKTAGYDQRVIVTSEFIDK